MKNNLKSRNSEYAVLSTLRKDHKTTEDPGNIGYNYRFIHIICTLLRDVTGNKPTECENTEDLNTIEDDIHIRSLDVKA